MIAYSSRRTALYWTGKAPEGDDAMIIELADGADERLADYTRLTDVALRRRPAQ